MNRQQALLAGAPRYEGPPCKHGHGTTRYTANHVCVECARRHSRKWALSGEGDFAKPPRAQRRAQIEHRILRALQRKPRTINELVTALGAQTRERLRDPIRDMHAARRVHIADWQRTRGRFSIVYGAGDAPDAPMPEPLTRREQNARAEARRQADPERRDHDARVRSARYFRKKWEGAAHNLDALQRALFGSSSAA